MKKKRLALITLLIALVTVFTVAFAACGSGKSKAKVTLDPTTLSVAVGGSGQIKATADENPTWSIEDNSIATIAALGKICSVKGVKEGSTKVIAQVGEEKAECTVTVTANDTETIVITNAEGEEVTTLTLDAGADTTLTATASKGSAVTWESSVPRVASVDQTGKVTALRGGDTVITAKVSASIKAEVALHVNSDAESFYYDLTFSEEGSVTEDTWHYWTESWVQVESASFDSGTVSITFSNNAATDEATGKPDLNHFWTTQLFYKNTTLESGERYKLTFTAESTASGKVTLNSNVVNLQEGTHQYTVYYVQSGTSWAMQFGVNGGGMDIESATISFSNIVWAKDTEQEKLAAPSFSYNASTKVITITDTENNAANVGGYKLCFLDNENVQQAAVYVTNGTAVDLSAVSNGTYTTKLIAVAANIHYLDSDPSSASATIAVENDRTVMANGSENADYGAKIHSLNTPNTWLEWHDEGWNGANVTLGDSYIDANNAIHYSWTSTGSAWYHAYTQLFYKYSSHATGDLYTYTMKITSSAAGSISVNGEDFNLEANTEKSITVTRAELGNNASIAIQFDIAATSVTISDITCNAAQTTQLTAPSFSISEGVITITDTANDAANVGSYLLGFFADENATSPVSTVAVVSGEAVKTGLIANNTYCVRLQAKGASALYTDSAWSDTHESFTVNNAGGVQYDLESPFTADNAATNPGSWGIWAGQWDWTDGKSNVTVTSAEYNNGTITIQCTIEGGSSAGCLYALQVNYVNPNYTADTTYSFTIESTADITVQVENGATDSVNLTANQAQTLTGAADASFYLQVNAPAGANIQTTITISNVNWA